ncbi:hypothetical protein [Nonomuraea ferruginea]|uniref:Uncharacterized protein n=1 Tax=Nonomuraea ferruginea TaxID=46174 RepID=A0ABT4SZJ7_9ACTN|nr:hypothetical protein [Nonomuraea ferruginea]MDA0642692.1 hypothetical protein [Nonomuraea ferruginea]
MPFDPEATGIIPRLDLDAAKDRADTPNPADADQPTDGSADDRPSDEEAAEEPPADAERPARERPADAKASAERPAGARPADVVTDAERPAGARAAASSGGDSAEDERGAKRDSEDVSQTLTFRIPGPPSVHIGRPPTAEEAAAAAAPPPASKGTTASKAQSVPEKTRSAQKAVPETEKTRSGEKSVPEAEKTRSGEKAVPEAETPSGQKAAPETEARSGTKAVAEAEGARSGQKPVGDAAKPKAEGAAPAAAPGQGDAEPETATLPKLKFGPSAKPTEDVSGTTPFPAQQARKDSGASTAPPTTDFTSPSTGGVSRPAAKGSPAPTARGGKATGGAGASAASAPAKGKPGQPGAKAEDGGQETTSPQDAAATQTSIALQKNPAAPQTPAGPRKDPAAPQAPKALQKDPAAPQGPASLQKDPAEAPAASKQGAAAAQTATAVRQKPVATPGAAGEQGGRWARLLASAPRWLPVLLVLEGLVMYVLAVKAPPGPYWGVDPEEINGLGLISALPVTAFAAILIMVVSFFVTVAQSTDRKFLLLFQIAAITFALHGVGALVAEEPRFPTAYIHAGFVEFIGRTGETAINIDARMGWPGFFALFAFVTKAAGIEDLTPILNWSPLLSNLLYLLPFVLILRQVVATTRARWFAALLFILVQWIGQDYFSPQGFTFALYLVFVAILLRWFGRVEPRTKPIPPKGLRRLLARLDAMTPGELANTGMFRADKLLMLMLLLALFVAATASHQITPFMMLGVLTAFLLFKRTSLTWGLPFFLGLVVLTWISYMAVGFWVGQIDTIFGGLGRVLDNLQTNTGDRIEGTDALHALVLQARLGILVVILALAAVGLFRRLHRGVFDRAALILLCVPALALAMQSYGGEMGLRIYMFALPGACLLAAYAFFPNMPADSADVREETVPLRKRNVRFNPDLTRKISLVLAACMAVAFAGAFLVARYGNEKFERVTSGEVAAMHHVYEHDKPSARVVYLVPKLGPEVTPTLPWGERDIELVNFAGQAQVFKDPTNITGVIDSLKPGPESPRNTYVVVSRGQVSYLQLNEGFPEGWGEKFRAALDAAPELKRVFSNDDAALYTWGKFVRGTEIPDPRPYKVQGEPTSPWTPVGIGALAVTWIALFGYEVIRLNGPRRAPRARRWMLAVAIPAFAVALGVIVERFVYIAGLN